MAPESDAQQDCSRFMRLNRDAHAAIPLPQVALGDDRHIANKGSGCASVAMEDVYRNACGASGFGNGVSHGLSVAAAEVF